MDKLRLIIFFIGLAVIAGIYLRYREPKQSSDDAVPDDKSSLLDKLKVLLPRKQGSQTNQDSRIGPQISIEDVDSLGAIKVHGSEVTEDELAEGVHIGWDSMTPVSPQDELLIVFNILAKPEQVFTGVQIQSAATQTGFVYGDMQIFHYHADKLSNDAPAVCSFANLLQPGHFAGIETDEFTTPGISLFAQLPSPLEAREAFKLTLDKAHVLAESLGGELCDETRSILTEQTIGHIKEKVEAFRFKQQMAAMKQRRHER